MSEGNAPGAMAVTLTLSLIKRRGHAPGELDDRGLGRLVAVGFPGVDAQAVDRGDIDDLARLSGASGRFEWTMQGPG